MIIWCNTNSQSRTVPSMDADKISTVEVDLELHAGKYIADIALQCPLNEDIMLPVTEDTTLITDLMEKNNTPLY